MVVLQLTSANMDALWALQLAYKKEIGEETPTDSDRERLRWAMDLGQIIFYGCEQDGKLIGCCSVTPTFSTFDYRGGGVLEDFYILPTWRHRGVARALISFAVQMHGEGSLTVGCADCDLDLYRALGFTIPIGTLLAYDRDALAL